METTIQKWGNSLAVRLPKGVATKLALREGCRVEVREAKEGILIRQAPKARRSLKELVHMMRHEQLHGETPWGSASGKEVW
jgi:antitoxin MazE